MICAASGPGVLSIVAEGNWHLSRMCGGAHLVIQPPTFHCFFLCAYQWSLSNMLYELDTVVKVAFFQTCDPCFYNCLKQFQVWISIVVAAVCSDKQTKQPQR